MDINNTNLRNSVNQSSEDEIRNLKAEISRLSGYENIVNGFMAHENICLAVFQKIPPVPVFINRGLEILSGYTRAEIFSFTKSDFEKIIHSDMREEFFQRYYKRLKGEILSNSFELKMVRKDGTVLTVQAFVYLIEYNKEPSIVITIVDMTKMRETEKALRASEENYRLLFNRTPVSIFYFDKNLRISHFNDRFVELLQSTREKLSGLDLNIIHDRSIIPCLNSAVNGKNGFYRGRYKATTSDAEIFVSMKTEPLFNDAGEVAGGVGIIEDIKQVYETEEALLKSEENFKEMIDLSPLAIAVTDSNDNLVYNNRACIDLFLFNKRNITNFKSWWENAYPDSAYRQCVIDDWYSGFKNSQIQRERFGPKEYKVTCGDGSVHDIEFHVVPVGDRSFIIMNDMTHHRKAEAELVKTKKIESLGILAGGIAHDFNNILTAVIGNINLAKMEITEDHKSYPLLVGVEKAAWRARDLTQQLLTFSRGGEPIKKVTSVKQLLVDSASFALTGSDIKFEFSIADDLRDAEIDEGQISQVIHNLVLNARESMTGCGVISISAENFKCTAEECPVRGGDCIKIRIEDSGSGITSSNIPNIFDPFFTTKSAGTGLGLSVSYSIIKKHGGDIKVSSLEGTGTVFDIFLPASEKKSVSCVNPEVEPQSAAGSLLVMDDEDLILDITKKMLSRMGYKVETAKNGEETIALYKEAMEKGARFDCVIMDLTIPGGMGGKETLRVLKEYDPGVTAIVSSGYSNDPVMSKYKEYGFAGVSEKPYSFEDLRKEIERILAGKP
jgi:PAS domain S-box-containing protein